MGDSMQTASGAANGFWGTVLNAGAELGQQFGQGVFSSAGDIVRQAGSQLPVWAAGQLGLETGTNIGISNPLDTSLGNLSAQTRFMDDVTVQEAPLFQGLDKQTVIAGGIVLLAVILIFKVL